MPSALALVLTLVALDGIESIEVRPTSVRLDGPDRRARLVVTGVTAGSRRVDLTHDPELILRSLDPATVRVGAGGELAPVADGRTTVVASYLEREAGVRVTVTDSRGERPVDFAEGVVPVLTRLGCSAGACHGKSLGQNGFRLSLLGSDPAFDHESLTREGRGRRVFVARPASSLMLLKPTGRVPHGGGVRLAVGSPEYATIERWIAGGAFGPPVDVKPGQTRLAVEPERGVLAPGATQQLRAAVRDENGAETDVTRLTRFDAITPDVANADDGGLVRAGDRFGEAIVTARYGGDVAVARFAVPKPGGVEDLDAFAEPDNTVDRGVLARLRTLGERPVGPCTDAEFARRSTLDLAGVLPEPEEVEAFEADGDPLKRARWVDRWLNSPGYANRMAMEWSALLRNRRTLGPLSQPGTFALHDWVRRAFASNRPFDRFAADLLTARGDPGSNPAVIWYRTFDGPDALANDVGQLFLGVRLECARCHRHPSDRWGPDDYRGFSALFDRVGRKPGDDPVTPEIYVAEDPATSATPPRWLGGPPLDGLKASDDPRAALVGWLRRPDNPYFARAVVNRVWKQYLGRGLVEPEDDFRASNPPSHPELLDALADEFVAGGYDLKGLARSILLSRTYGRSSVPEGDGPGDPAGFGRFVPRRLPAEVLLDAIDRLTGIPTDYEGLPPGTRAVALPDEGFDTPGGFLSTFGRPRRESACGCERSDRADLSQGLFLLNAAEVERKVGHPGGRAARLARDGGPDEGNVRRLYRIALSRGPTAEELAACLAHLARRRAEGRVEEGYEDLIWAIINTKEFQFIL